MAHAEAGGNCTVHSITPVLSCMLRISLIPLLRIIVYTVIFMYTDICMYLCIYTFSFEIISLYIFFLYFIHTQTHTK